MPVYSDTPKDYRNEPLELDPEFVAYRLHLIKTQEGIGAARRYIFWQIAACREALRNADPETLAHRRYECLLRGLQDIRARGGVL